jgi:hypothetical protein
MSDNRYILDDETDNDKWFPKDKGRGLVEPPAGKGKEMSAPPSEIKLITQSEWSDRIKEKEAKKSRMKDIGHYIENINQGQVGYCWAHSNAHCVAFNRAVSNQPYIALSAYMVAAIIKKGRDEGGWCGLSRKFMSEVGICSQTLWPQGNRDYKKMDTPAVRANAELHKITEDWVDLSVDVYDQNLTFAQVATCMLLNIPCAVDFNHWSHSVCAVGLVEVEPGSFGLEIYNSWGPEWGENGYGILRGQKAIPDGATAIRVTGGSVE